MRIVTAGIVLLASITFLAWLWIARPDPRSLPALARIPLAAQLTLGIGFAAANAALEEVVFRGFALQELRALFHSRWVVVLIQAAAFGASHYGVSSVPDGVAGAIMTFVYGIALGALAILAEGILACWVAHFLADVLVFLVMVGWL